MNLAFLTSPPLHLERRKLLGFKGDYLHRNFFMNSEGHTRSEAFTTYPAKSNLLFLTSPDAKWYI